MRDNKQTIMQDKKGNFDLYNLSRYRNEIYGASILWIVLYHAFMINYEWPIYLVFLKCGIASCDVFLFLSGISLYFSYLKYESTFQFYVKRMLRIYIPLFTIFLPYLSYDFHSLDISISKYIVAICARVSGFLFWIDGYHQIWFISLIIVLYLFYPLIIKFISGGKDNEGRFIRTMILCTLELALMLLIRKLFPSYYENVQIALVRLPIFTVGCYMGPYVYNHILIPGKALYMCLMVSIVAFVVFGIHWLGYYTAGQITQLFFGGIAITFCLAKLFDLLNNTKLCFFNKAMRCLGGATLEMYIIHIAVILLYRDGRLFSYAEGNWMYYLILMCICFIIAILFNRIDQGILSYINSRWIKKHEQGKS